MSYIDHTGIFDDMSNLNYTPLATCIFHWHWHSVLKTFQNIQNAI